MVKKLCGLHICLGSIKWAELRFEPLYLFHMFSSSSTCITHYAATQTIFAFIGTWQGGCAMEQLREKCIYLYFVLL